MTNSPTLPPSRLRIVYRSHGGENMKSRPEYYSKLLALLSLVRAADTAGGPGIVFWNDGPIPADRLDVMRAHGEVAQIEAGSNRQSYRAAIDMVARRNWPDGDLVWFAEDDYLYHPEAFTALLTAMGTIRDADYVSVFGGLALDVERTRRVPEVHARWGAADVPDAVEAGGVRWFRGLSTTSTFGVRLGALREDRTLLRVMPFTGGAWDHTSCLAVQGLQPFPWEEIRSGLVPAGGPVALARGVVRGVVRGAVQGGVNLAARRPEGRRRHLYLCDPVRAVHLELPDRDDPTDPRLDPFWPALAAETWDWARAHGLAPSPSGGRI